MCKTWQVADARKLRQSSKKLGTDTCNCVGVGGGSIDNETRQHDFRHAENGFR
jgi:hypothetical protein